MSSEANGSNDGNGVSAVVPEVVVPLDMGEGEKPNEGVGSQKAIQTNSELINDIFHRMDEMRFQTEMDDETFNLINSDKVVVVMSQLINDIIQNKVKKCEFGVDDCDICDAWVESLKVLDIARGKRGLWVLLGVLEEEEDSESEGEKEGSVGEEEGSVGEDSNDGDDEGEDVINLEEIVD